MRVHFYLILMLLFLLTSSCKKENTTIINNNTLTSGATPAYIVLGLHDVKFISGLISSETMYITVQYLDSQQRRVSLSLSGLPEGITIDSNWAMAGVPTYNTTIRISNDASVTRPGTYPITFTATDDSGMQRVFVFNIKVVPVPPLLMGKYSNCVKYCTGETYTDSLYLDPVVQNKIWFTNFGNWGNLVYGYLTGGGLLTIPQQTSGSRSYNFQGDFSMNHHINVSLGSSCAIDMY